MKKEDLLKSIQERIDGIECQLEVDKSMDAFMRNSLMLNLDIYYEMMNSIKMIDVEMNKDVAVSILEKHNAWRRDQEMPNTKVMVDPATLGEAIDYAIEYMKEH